MNILEKFIKWIRPSPKILLVLTPKPIELSPDESKRLIRVVERHKRVQEAIRKNDKPAELRKDKVKLEYFTSLKKEETKLGHLIEVLK